jgi:hypothetical protein
MAESQATNPPTGPAAASPLEPEADDWDGDSAVGVEDLASSTVSIGSSILRYRKENGRTYHAYKVCFFSSLQCLQHQFNSKRTDNTPSRTTNRKMIVWISNTISLPSHSKENCSLLLFRRSKPSIAYLTLAPALESGQLTLQMNIQRRKSLVSI